MSDPTASCPICASSAASIGVKSGHSIYECPACSLRFTLPDLAQDLQEVYGERYFTSADAEYGDYLAEEPAHRRQAVRYLQQIQLVHPVGSLLDIGGAAGFFADEARKHGWSAQMVEVSPYAANRAEAIGVKVVRGAFPDVNIGGQFDAVTFFNSLEHLPELRRAEQRLRELVKPGGVVVIETWDWRSFIARIQGLGWHQYHPEYVPHYFDRRSLRLLFNASEWRMLEFRRATKWISMRRALDILASKYGAGALRAIGRSRVGALDVPYRMGDLVWVVFRRADARVAAQEGAA